MNKIKKFLLIIPILFIIGIQNVKADERYIYTNGISSWGTGASYSNSYSNSLENFNNYIMLDNNYHFGFSSGNASANISVFKDNVNNLFYVIFYSSDYDINITSDYIYSYVDNSNVNVSFYVYVVGYESDDLNYIVNLYKFISNRTHTLTCTNCNNYKYAYVSRTLSNSEPHTYFYNNISNFELVYSSRNTYLNGVLLVPNSTPPTPEPEPIPQENYNKLYVPNYNENMCVEVLDKDTIRVFDDDTTLDYTDYYVNSHYLSKTGTVDSEYSKNCTQLEKSSSFIYRNDIPEILFIALLASLFTFLSIYMLFRVFRKRSR